MEKPHFVTFSELYANKTYLLEDDRSYPVVILVSEASSVYIDDADRELLEKILQSVNISLRKAKVINVQNLDESTRQQINLPSDHLISFGVAWDAIGQEFTTELYAVTTKQNKTYLKADTLAAIAKDKQKKIQLWQALKEFFSS